MSRQLIALSSGSRSVLSYNDYNYTNTNTNVSSHLCSNNDIDPASKAKDHDFEKALVPKEKTIF
jgi:hypothetical protein